MVTKGVAYGTQLWAWNGVAWVEVLANADGTLRVDMIHADIVQTRITATGLVFTGACYLHWITVNPSAPNSIVILTDSLVALAVPVWGYTRTARDSDHINFTPAMKFSTGLYVETLTAITALNIAYDTG